MKLHNRINNELYTLSLQQCRSVFLCNEFGKKKTKFLGTKEHNKFSAFLGKFKETIEEKNHIFISCAIRDIEWLLSTFLLVCKENSY